MNWEWMKKYQDQMEEEIEGACEYIKCATSLKDSDRAEADTYYQMAQQELNHFNNLDKMAKIKLEEMVSEENYDSMKILYDYLRERLMDKMAKISAMMTMYKS